MTKLIGKTIKETPKNAQLPSHQLLLRAGMVRQYSAGVYGLLPLAKRSVKKIEQIIREEMDRVDGLEVALPCLSTRELWSETGRYQNIGSDMFRLQDRHQQDMLLCMTHEEPAVHMARNEATSYKNYPFMLYQIQTKFRDEPRPRGGLVRLREFSMKDAYSFHTSEEDLENYYYQVHEAYERIFKRMGIKKFVSVKSDNGIFGGAYSHEFMSLTPSGEDTIFICESCDYRANKEVASSPFRSVSCEVGRSLDKVSTPGAKTIESLAKMLGIESAQTGKAVLFQTKAEGRLVAAFVRGDLDVMSVKLEGAVGQALEPASSENIIGAGGYPGSTGPRGLDLGKALVVIDPTLDNLDNFAIGANEADFHLVGFNIARDFESDLSEDQKKSVVHADIAEVRQGDPCPECGSALEVTRGIEIGNIFHLGIKYSGSMGFSFLDVNGKAQTPIMGCYGIGVTRGLAAVIEDSHDDDGIIFPMSVAPYEVQLNVINYKKPEVRSAADSLYSALRNIGVEVLFDDRDLKPGFQFKDADLLGTPIRVLVSPKTLAGNEVEFVYRDRRVDRENLAIENAAAIVAERVAAERARFVLD